jgi:hypothetical protein
MPGAIPLVKTLQTDPGLSSLAGQRGLVALRLYKPKRQKYAAGFSNRKKKILRQPMVKEFLAQCNPKCDR